MRISLFYPPILKLHSVHLNSKLLACMFDINCCGNYISENITGGKSEISWTFASFSICVYESIMGHAIYNLLHVAGTAGRSQVPMFGTRVFGSVT